MRVGRVEAGGKLLLCEPDGDGVRLLDGSIAQGVTRGTRRLSPGEYRVQETGEGSSVTSSMICSPGLRF